MTKSPARKTAKPVTKKSEKNRGLGRGLSALMSDISIADVPAQGKTTKKTANTKTKPSSRGVSVLAMDQLERNPDQPRRYFDKDKLAELTASIKDKGVLQPILVRKIPGNDKGYQIVAGERRWQARRQ